ncbi:TadE family protein [Microbacterium lacusdiani]
MRRSNRCRDAARRLRRLIADDAGSAALEFLTVGVLMLVPLTYLVLALGQIQSQTLGVESAARFTARVIASGPAAGDPDAVLASVTREYGIQSFDADVSCRPAGPCPAQGGTVLVTVTASVKLPLVPPLLGLDRLAVVPVEATAVQKVSRFWEAG